MRKLVAVATLSLLVGAGGAYLAGAQAPVLAQTGHAGHGAAAKGADTAATKAFRAANDKMHEDMDITFSGDADVDFLKGMIPHHQGAIDMAKVVLAHGKDPAVKKLATEIIKAQEGEIAMMKDWLHKKGVH